MEIPFFVSGFVLSQEGANGHLLFSVNDQSMVVDFPQNSDNDFVQQFNYNAHKVRACAIMIAWHEATGPALIR
jgi:hypothetical protein